MLCLLMALAGCGDLPRPFQGAPGATAMRLAQPPPARLAVPVPRAALLPAAAAGDYAAAVVAALQDQDVPAVIGRAHKGDWRLDVTAEAHDGTVVPSFTVANPAGVPQGSMQGAPVDAGAWADGAASALKTSAANAAPAIASLLTGIEAARRQNDPNSLANRPARVVVGSVTGAPGDGNTSLTKRMREQLPQHGEVVQDSADGADFTVQGTVKLAPGSGGTDRVEIQWTVSDAQGRDLGHVVQLNDVPPHSLDAYWGDVALVVAQEAAGGIRDVIANASGARGKPVVATKPGGVSPAAPPFRPQGAASPP